MVTKELPKTDVEEIRDGISERLDIIALIAGLAIMVSFLVILLIILWRLFT